MRSSTHESSTRSPARFALLAAVTLVTTLSAARSRACWDGFYASLGGVAETGGDQAWDEATLRHRARWLGRIDALLPSGATVFADHGLVEVSVGGRTHEVAWSDGRYRTLFDQVARVVGAGPAVVARARRRETPVYVVQAAAFADAARARAHAEALSATDAAQHGFVQVGGFPADNPEAHVVSGSGGRTVHRVYVGAFVDRSAAEAVARSLGDHAFVRAL